MIVYFGRERRKEGNGAPLCAPCYCLYVCYLCQGEPSGRTVRSDSNRAPTATVYTILLTRQVIVFESIFIATYAYTKLYTGRKALLESAGTRGPRSPSGPHRVQSVTFCYGIDGSGANKTGGVRPSWRPDCIRRTTGDASSRPHTTPVHTSTSNKNVGCSFLSDFHHESLFALSNVYENKSIQINERISYLYVNV